MSNLSFVLDLGPLEELIARSKESAMKGAKNGLDVIKDDWIVKSRNIAPLDTGNLIRQINGTVEGNGFQSHVVVTGNATSRGRKRFNYGYYIHEGLMAADGKKLKRPDAEEQFLSKVGEENQQDWMAKLEREIETELRRAGW
ncbi:hypothetical protein [Neobacillus mesonae]|uniref:HK97 gp10 family phage protein n=1 Tax=Neobacillus mesonae TaxID=1193713 RepID=A0A3Q9QUU9_9BACI|nr:hypothetical protein [Neobacillus mesonae]AZU61071.1 hypothetical protein CHR53_07285 [Neobacillus mesonae]